MEPRRQPAQPPGPQQPAQPTGPTTPARPSRAESTDPRCTVFESASHKLRVVVFVGCALRAASAGGTGAGRRAAHHAGPHSPQGSPQATGPSTQHRAESTGPGHDVRLLSVESGVLRVTRDTEVRGPETTGDGLRERLSQANLAPPHTVTPRHRNLKTASARPAS